MITHSDYLKSTEMRLNGIKKFDKRTVEDSKTPVR